ncbi:MAG: ATP-binding protein [Acidimicrobiales bacterium]
MEPAAPPRPEVDPTAGRVLPLIGPLRAPRVSPPTRRTLLRGILAFRWLSGTWMAAVFLWEIWERRGDAKPGVDHPLIGIVLLVAAFAVMGWLTTVYQRDPDRLTGPAPIATEIAVASSLLFADMWVYGATHSQALPTIWPLGVIFTVAIAAGTRPAVITGIGLGLSRYAGWLLSIPDDESAWSMTRIASTVLFAVGGWVAGYLINQQAEADRSISAFRAREEVARTLHDGVLQTLAVIQRRSDDSELVELARSQELELRQYLFDGTASFHGANTDDDLAATLRAVALRIERRDGLHVDVICAPDLPPGERRAVHAIGGAVTEALTNAAKHGRADKAIVYAEPGDDTGVFVSVKDNGVGFDPATVQRGQGLNGSIAARISDAGGRVEIDGRPGRGAEIRMWL